MRQLRYRNGYCDFEDIINDSENIIFDAMRCQKFYYKTYLFGFQIFIYFNCQTFLYQTHVN